MMNINHSARAQPQSDSGQGPETKKNDGIKNFFKTLFSRSSSSGKSTDEVKDSLSNNLSGFNKAKNLAKEAVIKNNNVPTTHITKDSTINTIRLSQQDHNPLLKPTKNASVNLTKEQINQNVKDNFIRNMTNAVHLEKLEMTWCKSPVDIKRNAGMLENLNGWKREIPILIKMIASSAVLDKSERPHTGPQSLSGLKQQLLERFRSSAEYAMSDTYSQEEINADIETLNNLLLSIDPDQDAQKKINNENRTSPKYIPQPPMR